VTALLAQLDTSLGTSDIANSTQADARGRQVSAGLAEGITGAQASVTTAASTVASAAIAQLDASFGISADDEGGCTQGSRVGTAVVDGITSGMSSRGTSDTFAASASSVQSGAKSALDTAFGIWSGWGNGPTSGKFEYIGKAIVDGVAYGIRQGQSSLTAAASAAATAAYNAAKAALGISSPSRRMMEIGRYYSQGFARGIDDAADAVSASVRRLSRLAMDDWQSPAAAPEGIDYERLAAALSSGGSPSQRGITINQTINSPSQLSPHEVARQTRGAARALAGLWT
ncbi:MAG: hypothetical protein ACI4P5_04870, partial [Candidatus Fimadaptatus sp.]